MDTATDELLLEEAEWKELAERAKNFPLDVSHRDLLEFIESITNAQRVSVNESD